MSYTVVSYSDDTKGVGFCKVVVLLGIICRTLYTITRLAWHIVSNPAVSRLSVTLPPLIRPDSANFRHIPPNIQLSNITIRHVNPSTGRFPRQCRTVRQDPVWSGTLYALHHCITYSHFTPFNTVRHVSQRSNQIRDFTTPFPIRPYWGCRNLQF